VLELKNLRRARSWLQEVYTVAYFFLELKNWILLFYIAVAVDDLIVRMTHYWNVILRYDNDDCSAFLVLRFLLVVALADNSVSYFCVF
jgi:hypothetical protein